MEALLLMVTFPSILQLAPGVKICNVADWISKECAGQEAEVLTTMLGSLLAMMDGGGKTSCRTSRRQKTIPIMLEQTLHANFTSILVRTPITRMVMFTSATPNSSTTSLVSDLVSGLKGLS